MESILEQFPERQSEIERLYLESADFRELCQDYKEVRSLVVAPTDSGETDQDAVDEYRALLQDLETEIKEYLNAKLRAAKLSDQDLAAHPIRSEEQAGDEAM